jgi:hypothetical protein
MFETDTETLLTIKGTFSGEVTQTTYAEIVKFLGGNGLQSQIEIIDNNDDPFLCEVFNYDASIVEFAKTFDDKFVPILDTKQKRKLLSDTFGPKTIKLINTLHRGGYSIRTTNVPFALDLEKLRKDMHPDLREETIGAIYNIGPQSINTIKNIFNHIGKPANPSS